MMEYIGLYEFSLESAALTGRYFVANGHPDYTPPTGRTSTAIAGLCGTSELVPGRYTLFVTTGMTASGGSQTANLCAVYDVAQSVKWIGMENWKGELAAGESSNFYLNFNTEGMKHGESAKCEVVLNADVAIEPYRFPVIPVSYTHLTLPTN